MLTSTLAVMAVANYQLRAEPANRECRGKEPTHV
jgi:hypothetical protein